MPSALPVKVSAGIVLVAFVGTPAGHATVPAGVPALVALDVPVSVAADTPEAEAVNNLVPLPEVASANVPGVWVCVPSALPANVGTPAGHEITCAGPVTVPFVPAGVPALTALVVAELPVNVSAGTVPALPLNVGTPAGQEIAGALFVPSGVTVEVPLVPAGVPPLVALVVAELPVKVSAGTVPGVPLNAGAATVPAGVKLAVAFDPVGVMSSAPPVVPTSPCAANVPITVTPSRAVACVNPAGHDVSVAIIEPAGTPPPPPLSTHPLELHTYTLGWSA